MSKAWREGPDGRDDEQVATRSVGPGKRSGTAGAPSDAPPMWPGKRTLTQHFAPRTARSPQPKRPTKPTKDVATERENEDPSAISNEEAATENEDPSAIASRGTSANGGALPHGDEIQASFGRHDISGIEAHVGGEAADASDELGARAYATGNSVAFASQPDLHTAAHEAAHVVQQQGGVALKAIDGGASDSHEQHADAVADAVVAGQSAEALLDKGAGGPAPAVQRKTEPEPFVPTSGDRLGGPLATTAQKWMWDWSPTLVAKLDAYLAATSFLLPSAFADWKAGNSAEFARAAWAPIAALSGKGQHYAVLQKILTPDALDPLINAGRDAPTRSTRDPFTDDPIQPKGSSLWAETVVPEIGKFLVKRIVESLARMLPRWIAARNQLALSSEGPVKTPDRDPKPGEVIPLHPIDPYVLTGFEGRLTANLKSYRLAKPEQNALGDMQLGRLQKVQYQWQHDQGAWNWVRVTHPPNATKEDVANTLYGDVTYAHTITDAAPLFGITDVEHLADTPRTEYEKHAATAKVPAKDGDDPDIDLPEQQMQAWGVLPEEVMLAQASKVKASSIRADESGRKVILDRMNAGLSLLQQIHALTKSMPHGGYDSLLQGTYDRLQKRAFKVAEPSTTMAMVLPYDGQTLIQNELLMKALNGLGVAVKQYEVFSAWPSSATATQQVGWLYLKVACLSEQANAAAEQYAAAEQQSKLFPVTVMELVLAEVRKVLHTQSGKTFTNDTDERHDAARHVAEHTTKEAKLRIGLARIRDKLLQGQDGAAEDLKELAKELIDLQNEVTIVSDLDAMEVAWQALYDDMSMVGVLTGATDDDADMIADIHKLRDQWGTIYSRYRTGDKAGAIKALQEKRPQWQEMYPKVGKLIKNNQTKNKWVTFFILVGIAVVTAGIGAYVEGAAAATWGAGAWATFAVTTGAEAVAFTSMSYFIVDNDPSISGFFLELGKNLLLFGALKGITGRYIKFVGKESAGTLDTMIVQFVAINSAALVEADVKKYLKHGEHLTMDEVLEISKQNAMFMVAAGLATMAAKPGIESLRLTGEADAVLARVRGLKTELRELGTELQNSKNVDEAKGKDLLGKQRELLIAEEAALQRLESIAADPKLAKKAGLDGKEMQNELLSARKEHDTTVSAVRSARVLDMTEGAGTVRWAQKGANFDEVERWWKEQDGATVKDLVTDRQFGARGIEVTPKDGATFRLLERTSDNAQALAGSPDLATKGPTAEQVIANQKAAEEAGILQDQHSEAIMALIDAQAHPHFKRIQIGGEAAGLFNQASMPKSGGGGATPGSKTIPEFLTVAERGEAWRERGPVNQMPGEVAGPGLDAARMQVNQHNFVEPTAVADAIKYGKYHSGMSIYRGRAIGEVEYFDAKRPDGWDVPAAAMRVKVRGPAGEKYFYADAIDLANGPGPSKLIPEKAVVGGTEGKGYQEMVEDGRLTYGDQAPTKARDGVKKVVVWGGSGNAAAMAEHFAKLGCEVWWVARPSTKGINPAVRPEYDAIVDALSKKPAEPLASELKARKETLEAFSFAMLPRNVAEAFESPIAQANIKRHIGELGKIDTIQDAAGKKSVKVEINGVVEVFDQMIVSQGQNTDAPGAMGGLANRFKLQLDLILDGDGRLVGLESVNPKGGLRLMGAGFADAKMADYVVPHRKAEFLQKLTEDSLQLPDNSKGVGPSLANSARNITAANDILAAKEFKIGGSIEKLVLPVDARETWPAKVASFLGGELGIDPARLKVDIIEDGRSGDPVFRVRVGAEELGYFKVFSKENATVELSMLQKLKDAQLEKMKVVDTKGSIPVEGGGTGQKTGVLMSTAEGHSVTEIIDKLPIDPGPRADAIKRLEIAVKNIAEGLAEMHGKLTDGFQTEPQKRADAKYIIDKLDQIKNSLGDAHYERIKAILLEKILPEYVKANVPATGYHGDANTGNFMIDGKNRVSTIDLDKMQYSFDKKTGKAVGTGAADVGRFLESLASRPQLLPFEVQTLTDAFNTTYFGAMKGKVTAADLEAATKLYQVEFEIVKIRNASNNALKIADTSAESAFWRLDALVGISGEFKPPRLAPPIITRPPDDDKKSKKSQMPDVIGDAPTIDPDDLDWEDEE